MPTTQKGDGDEQSEEHFRKNLRARREALGVSQAALAEDLERLGYPLVQQTIAKIESGKRPVRLDEAVALARALDTSLDQLSHPTLPETSKDVRAQLKALRGHVTELEERLPLHERLYLEAKAELEELDAVFSTTKMALLLARARIDLLEARLAELQGDARSTRGAQRGKHQAKG